MNDKWTDFEKHVFKELASISARLAKIEGKVLAYGAVAGMVAGALGEVLVKFMK